MNIMPKKKFLLFLPLIFLLGFFLVYFIFWQKPKLLEPKLSPEFLKGVVYSPYYPGETGGDILPNDDRYFDHLLKIKELGANTISVFPEFMPTRFFEALDESGLFYVPIININLYDGSDNSDLLGAAYQEKVLAHIKEVIDYNYKFGRPDKIAYFVLGYEINPQFITSTNSLHKEATSFSGEFISLKNRRPVEIALAKFLDAAISYEKNSYSKRHLYSHISFPASGFFPDFFDLIAVNLYPSYFYPDEDSFVDYLNKLSSLNKPVIISEFGFSTAPGERNKGVPSYEDGSDKSAAKLFTLASKQIMSSQKIKGLFFFEFVDEYWKNGEEASDSNIQNPNDSEEWFGLYEISNNEKGVVLQSKPEITAAVKEIFKSK